MDLPIDSVRHSRKIWNHLDELRINPTTVPLLARNAVRVGVASPAAWPAIETILHAAGGELHREQLITQQGLPATIVVSAIGEPETIFSYARAGRLTGKTFPAGNKLIQFEYAFHPELGNCTELQLSFEVQHDRGGVTWERRGEAIRQVPAIDRFAFEELNVLVTLDPGEFLVIGPSEKADNEYLVGSRYFTGEKSGRSYETLYCITPQPFQTEHPGDRSRG